MCGSGCTPARIGEIMKELLETGAASELGYSGKCDALVGKVKDLSVVIKENNQIKSYGCLIWVKKKGSTSDDELYSYLSEQVAAKPHIIKHFKTTGRGAALALVKYNDPVRNINNINRFLGDLADDLYAHDYVNCCYACGSTENLGIYMNGGSVVQYCGECAVGSPVTAGDEPDPEEQVYETEETGNDDLMAAMTAAAAEVKAEEIAETMEDLLADPADVTAEPVESVDREIISAKDDNVDLSGFMVDESASEESAETQDEEISEDARREYEEKQRLKAEETRSELNSLMFSESDAAQEERNEAPAADPDAFGNANTYIEDETDLDGLMYDGTDSTEETAGRPEHSEDVDNANIYGLMLGSEQDVSGENEELEVTEVTEVTAIGRGSGEDLQVTVQEEEDVGENSDVEVTELYDDSNEGEDIEIEELGSDFNMPTDTSGGEIEAEETPLEEDGSVPMVNPNVQPVKVTSGREPGDVRAFAYGSYENANTAEEPVGFDGRPKGYQGTDPRLGDEMGSVSRDYKRQQAAMTAPGAKKFPAAEQRVVSKGKPASSKPINRKQPKRGGTSGNSKPRRERRVSSGSNAAVGIFASLLFGIIGSAIWCGIGYLLGLMSTFDTEVRTIVLSVFAFLPTMFVFIGYKIGGDYFDGKGIGISVFLSLVMDAVGMLAVMVTGEMQKNAQELGFNIPFDKTIGNVMNSMSNPASSDAMMRQLGVSAAVMVITLVVSVVVAKRKK